MSAQLTLDEMLQCLKDLDDPRAQEFRTILESVGTLMAQTLAEKLGVVALPANSEGPDLAGTCAGFRAAFEGQDCPAVLAAFDPDGWPSIPSSGEERTA
jgi:uncharacterized protein with GYD domain